MTLSEQARRDLHRLVLQRVDDAVGDVAQLLDDSEQVAHLLSHVALSAAFAAATYLHETMKMPNGKPPPLDACQVKVLTFIAEGFGMQSKVVSGDEAERAGFKV